VYAYLEDENGNRAYPLTIFDPASSYRLRLKPSDDAAPIDRPLEVSGFYESLDFDRLFLYYSLAGAPEGFYEARVQFAPDGTTWTTSTDPVAVFVKQDGVLFESIVGPLRDGTPNVAMSGIAKQLKLGKDLRNGTLEKEDVEFMLHLVGPSAVTVPARPDPIPPLY